jgi:hypothetical protein
MNETRKHVAITLARRWGLTVAGEKAVYAWMTKRGLTTIIDFMKVFPGTHSESMDRGLSDFWEFAT